MSLYVEWLNQIKARADEDWLTDGQRKAYESVLERWASVPFVCLYGPPGCGKTFVARLLAQHHGYVYTHDLSEAPPGSPQVLLDSVEYTRLLRNTATLSGLHRVILVSRHIPKDPMPRAEICLTTQDVAKFQRNLTRHDVLASFLTQAEGTDLGQLLRNEAIKRGLHHVAF